MSLTRWALPRDDVDLHLAPHRLWPWRRSPRPGLLLALACLGVALAAADTYVVVLALPDMMAGVGLGIDQLQRAAPIISGFLLGYVRRTGIPSIRAVPPVKTKPAANAFSYPERRNSA